LSGPGEACVVAATGGWNGAKPALAAEARAVDVGEQWLVVFRTASSEGDGEGREAGGAWCCTKDG
jgi:hypothetical protein